MPRLTALLACLLLVPPARAQESLWLEAEHFVGLRGHCWPMGKPEMKRTNGHWGLAGPGWAAEWNQGGESNFLSIAAGADDDHATVTRTVEIPVAGRFSVWVRYADWREKPERFQVQIEQPGRASWVGSYGATAVVEEDNEMKLYFGWAFAWAAQQADLAKGGATLSLKTTTRDPVPRQLDVVVLTTDPQYRPRIKDRPKNHAWDLLRRYRGGVPDDLEPLARNAAHQRAWNLPDAWKLLTFRNQGFRYLWNVDADLAAKTWLSDKPDCVRFPYNLIDPKTREAFEKKYAGKDDVPIYSDPRIVPTFHGVGAGIFATDARTGQVNPAGKLFAQWLDAHPGRPWAMMMNYHPGQPIGEKGQQLFQRYHDRYLGSIAGESLGYFDVNADTARQATAHARTRRELVQALTPCTLQANAAKYRKVYGKDLDPNLYRDVISCLSVGNIAFIPLCADWGARTIGYESSAATSTVLPMRWAFMRGAARQHGNLTATYRSCNFGDSSTIFSKTSSFAGPENILDNYYSVYSGAGMTWYKMDLWYQYMAGSSMFYHEQGFDEFWQPGGTIAAGLHELQLSPKGKLVDRFLRVTKLHPDRGHPYTPVAFLVDHAHGWEPATFWPNAFDNWHHHPDRFLHDDHEQMLQQYFWTAFHPIGPQSERPMTGTNEVNVAGVFGDLFDCVFAYPDVKKWTTLDTYPVVIAAGDLELTDAEGRRLADYVEKGGTLLVADEHLTGPGVRHLKLPATETSVEADHYRWLTATTDSPSQRYRFKPIKPGAGLRPLARTPEGEVFCIATDRGRGRLIYLAVPRGLGIDRQVHPVVPLLLAHLTRGLMPIEVQGDVEWLLNRTSRGWVVTLLNPAGQAKPQQGITPTDYRENRQVTIRSRLPLRTASDWLMPDESLKVNGSVIHLEVPAGGVRIIELTE